MFSCAQQASFAIALANGRTRCDVALPLAGRFAEQQEFADLAEHERVPVLEHWNALSESQRRYILKVGLPFMERRDHAVAGATYCRSRIHFVLTLPVMQGAALYYTDSNFLWQLDGDLWPPGTPYG